MFDDPLAILYLNHLSIIRVCFLRSTFMIVGTVREKAKVEDFLYIHILIVRGYNFIICFISIPNSLVLVCVLLCSSKLVNDSH